MREKLKAAGIHLLAGLVLISLVFCLIYFVWYPAPFYQLSGGKDLLELIFIVDVVLGPLLTLVVYNQKKSLRERTLDIGLIVCLQLAALGYGLYTVHLARPVFVVFGCSRFRVVHANEPEPDQLVKASAAIPNGLPQWGPQMLGLRKPGGGDAQYNSTMLALGGLPEAAQADLWQAYEQVKPEVLATAKPVQLLRARFPARAAEIEQLLRQHQLTEASAVYVPIIIKDSFWTLVFDKSKLDKPYYLDLDSF